MMSMSMSMYLPSHPLHIHTNTPDQARPGPGRGVESASQKKEETSHLSISIKLAALVGVWACAEAMEENAVEGRSVFVVVVVRLVGMTEAPLPSPPP